MTERDLEVLIERGIRRVRLQHALRLGLATFGITLLVAAVGILIVRWTAAGSTWAGGSLAVPLVATVAVLVAAYIRYRPTPRSVAMNMDRTAGSAEHLVTWLELRGAPETSLTDTQQQFRMAQRASTLSVCQVMNPARQMPFRWPAWTRSLWLAVLFVLCALLMPERQAPDAGPLRAAASTNRNKIVQPGSPGGASMPNTETPRIEPLSQTEIMALSLQATNPAMTPEERERLEKEIKSRLPNVPVSALSPEIQTLLNTVAAKDVHKADAGKPDDVAASQKVGNDTEAHTPKAAPGIANIPAAMEKAFTTVREQYPDVKDELERYYKDVPPRKVVQSSNE